MKLSPSAAERWLSCTRSPSYLVENAHRLPEDLETAYSREGTEAHSHAAAALLFGYVEDSIPEHMRAGVKGWVELVESQVTGPKQLQVEIKVPLFYKPDSNGIVDAWVLTDECLYINDFKFGAGVMVEVRNNPQLVIYAESLIRTMELREKGLPEQFDVQIAVFQPRTREGEPLKVWRTSLGEVGLLASRIGAVASAILKDNREVVTFAPSPDACRWCPAKGFCEARAEGAVQPLRDAGATGENPFEVIKTACNLDHTALPVPVLEQLAVASIEGTLAKWLKDVQEYVQSLAMSGKETFPNLKVVESKKHRVWTNEEEAATLLKPKLKDKLFKEPEIISPSAAEKLLKGAELSTRFQNRFAQLVHQPKGEPVLALASDKRPSFNQPTPGEVFGEPLAEGDPLL